MTEEQIVKKNFTQSDKWLYAAALACLWASSEIVLGSFLHNLKIPMRGSILASIGVMIMVSAGMRWKKKGIFWRAGLITALMKAVSPSAVLLGPMLAIFTQGVLIEMAVKVGGTRKISFIIGGAIAVAWNFVQVILSYLLFYGTDVMLLYDQMLAYAARQFGQNNYSGQNILLIILLLYASVGVIAALIGIRASAKRKGPLIIKPKHDYKRFLLNNSSNDFPYSLYYFFLLLTLIVFVLYAIAYFDVQLYLPLTIAIISVLIIRYRAGLRRLAKWGFWIVFIIITMLSSFLLGDSINDGLFIGLKMNLRAVFLIISLASVSMELKHPKINAFLAKSGSVLPSVLQSTFATLPMVIAMLPDAKSFIRKPLNAISLLMSTSSIWIDSLKYTSYQNSPVLIISGEKGSGKSSLLNEMLNELNKKAVSFCGFIMKYRYINNKHIGYAIEHIPDKNEYVLAGDDVEDVCAIIGPYAFSAKCIDDTKKFVISEFDKSDIIIIDEYGPWEAMGGGWYDIFKDSREKLKPVIIVIRSQMIEDFLSFWNIKGDFQIQSNMEKSAQADIFNKFIASIKKK